MKTKKVLLGALVFVFAVGTAFASMYQQTPHIEAKTDPLCVEDFNCTPVTLPEDCNERGNEDCIVKVDTPDGDKETTVYDDAGCDDELKHDANPIDATETLTFCEVK